jgi:hypothetical protein
VSWLQQILLAAAAVSDPCAGVSHQAAAGVAHVPAADTPYESAQTIQTDSLSVPIAVDVLRGRGPAVVGPLVGETPIATATIQGGQTRIEGPAVTVPIVTPRCEVQKPKSRAMP